MTPDKRAELVCKEACESGNEYLQRLIEIAIKAAVAEERKAWQEWYSEATARGLTT